MMVDQIKLNKLNFATAQAKVVVADSAINKQKLFWGLFFGLVSLLGLYLYLVTQTIVNTADYQNFESKILSLDSEISGIESQYIALKKDIDLSLTKKLGYVEATNIKFINRNIKKQTLSLVPNN